MGTVSSIADRPRPIGSPRSDEVRDLLAGRLRAEGAEVEIQRAASAGAAGGTGVVGRVDNVVGMLPGTDPTGAVVLAAHYDSVAAGPGAADDAAGVAAVLETVRALTQGSPLRNDVVVLLTDGEEDGLFGARAFARDDPLRGRPAVVLNLEARGVSGPSMLVRTSPGNQRLVGALAAAAPHAAGDSALNETFRFVPNDTDVSQFLAVGRPALDFAIFEDAGRYHTPEDTPENLSEASLQHHGSTLLGLAGALGGTDLAPFDPVAGATPPVGDATYFPFLGAFVTYPDTWVVPIAALAALAVAGAAAVTARRSLLTVPRVMAGTASVALPVVVAGLLGQGLWTALLALRPAYGDAFLPGFLLRPLPTELAVLALAAAALAGWGLLLGRRVGAWALGVGGLVWLVLLGAVTALLAPGMSFLFALPALGGALGVLVAGLLRGAARPVTIAIGAVPSVAVLWPFVLATFDAGLSSAPAAAALAVLFGAPLAPLAASLRPRWPVAAVPLVVALALATAGLVIDRPDAEHPPAGRPRLPARHCGRFRPLGQPRSRPRPVDRRIRPGRSARARPRAAVDTRRPGTHRARAAHGPARTAGAGRAATGRHHRAHRRLRPRRHDRRRAQHGRRDTRRGDVRRARLRGPRPAGRTHRPADQRRPTRRDPARAAPDHTGTHSVRGPRRDRRLRRGARLHPTPAGALPVLPSNRRHRRRQHLAHGMNHP